MVWSAAVSTFLGAFVEFVEALTIVLVIGATINWKTALWGAFAAFLTLAGLIIVFGIALVNWLPIEALRLIVGTVLILFGLRWLKKAIMRYSGLKALHDEEAIYEEEIAALRARGIPPSDKINGFGFTTVFKSVLLEGLEVVFIVLTFGISAAPTQEERANGVTGAALGAVVALVLVILAGFVVRGPLTKVPENTLKFTVGLMLVAFGVYWAGEGVGVEWSLGVFSLVVLLAATVALSVLLIWWLRPYGYGQRHQISPASNIEVFNPPKQVGEAFNPHPQTRKRSLTLTPLKMLLNIWNVIFNFLAGDWIILIGGLLTIGLVALLEMLPGVGVGLKEVGQLLLFAGVALSLVATLRREIGKV
jgi:Ca2+/H+ antiporter, TMEM165/GDT1 family